MLEINFFTPIVYNSPSKSIGCSFLEIVDSYFYLGGKEAHIIQERVENGQEEAILLDGKSSLLARIGKIFSYCIVAIPLIMLIAKAILRSTHQFKLLDSKQKLEKGMNISEETAIKIQRLMPQILSGEESDELQWLSRGNNLVFKLTEQPDYIFKIAKPERSHMGDYLLTPRNENTDSRFKNMVKAKEVCLTHELGLLIIPHAKKFTVNTDENSYDFIVEESLDLDSSERSHEEHYHKYSTELDETARQLAIFVAKTGFNDVTWRNIPLLKEAEKKEAEEFQGSRRVALVDLEHMNSTLNGFIGDFNGSCGLISCMPSEAHIDIVIAEARKQGVAINEKQALDVKNRRLQELDSEQNLRAMKKREL